jgi:hypothetical protein
MEHITGSAERAARAGARPFAEVTEKSSAELLRRWHPTCCSSYAMSVLHSGMHTVALAALVLALGTGSAARAEPVTVRFIEGVTRGFLTVHTLDGKSLGQGDITQVVRNGRAESRMVLRFHDGSLHDEEVVFTQNKTFALVSYKLTQKGPSFPESMQVSLKNTGEYVVQSRKGDKDQDYRGTLELPPDTYNGLLLTLVRNLPEGQSASVHLVAFTPKPRLIGLDIVADGADPAKVGAETRPSRRYRMKPKLGVLLGTAAKLLGKTPPDQFCWVLSDPVPAFIACEAPLASDGPFWRIGVFSPLRGVKSEAAATR